MGNLLSRILQASLAALLLAVSPATRAQLDIEITGSGANRLPIAIADFGGERIISQALTSVLRADLDHSGLFSLVDSTGAQLSETSNINYVDWKNRGADALAAGSVSATADGRYEMRFRLADVQKQQSLGGQAFVAGAQQLRPTAHRISDYIYEKLLGEPGIFSTRIAYVVKSTGRYELQIADADGANAQTALASREPIISPAWSPEGTRLAYVSFEAKKPIVYVHSLATGSRHVAANFRGSNSSPAWSPDGKRLAVVLTKDGNSQIYLINADGSAAVRLETSAGIDTEPKFAPDGQSIYFTSDRGGSPQIYNIPIIGGEATRITFEGSYNVSPRLSPDGKSMAYVAGNGNRFQVALMDLATKQTQLLTESAKDESPSFSPNGRMIIYATEIGGRGVLASVSSDGRVKQKLSVQAADVREPTWGPFVR